MRGAVLRSPADRRVMVSSVAGRTGRAPGPILRLTTFTKLARALGQGNARQSAFSLGCLRHDRPFSRCYGIKVVLAIELYKLITCKNVKDREEVTCILRFVAPNGQKAAVRRLGVCLAVSALVGSSALASAQTPAPNVTPPVV